MYNYFAVFDIEPQFDIDLNLLEKKYIELNKTFHPDLNQDKPLAVKNTTNINKAYEILKSPLKRAEHLLHLLGNENIDSQRNLNAEVLEESMQIRESIFNCIDKQTLIKTIENKIKECIENLKNAFADKDLNKAIIQSSRLKYLNKSHEELRLLWN